ILAGPAGPQACAIKGSRVPGSLLEIAAAGRRYWGVPRQVQDAAAEVDERPPSHCIVWGHSMSDNSPTQNCLELMALAGAMAKGDIAKIPILVQTCGVHGRLVGDMATASQSMVSAVALWGMIRTIRVEMPQVQILTMDFAPGLSSLQIPRMLRPPAGVAESCYYNKTRWESQIVSVPSLLRRELKRDNLTGTGPAGEHARGKQVTKFVRKTFAWVGSNAKMDFCWYRQDWKA
ncbi:unnamed protein product, partial [Polarella glacialis]